MKVRHRSTPFLIIDLYKFEQGNRSIIANIPFGLIRAERILLCSDSLILVTDITILRMYLGLPYVFRSHGHLSTTSTSPGQSYEASFVLALFPSSLARCLILTPKPLASVLGAFNGCLLDVNEGFVCRVTSLSSGEGRFAILPYMSVFRLSRPCARLCRYRKIEWRNLTLLMPSMSHYPHPPIGKDFTISPHKRPNG